MDGQLKVNRGASRLPDAGPSSTDVRKKIAATLGDRATGPLLTPTQLAARYGLGLTRVLRTVSPRTGPFVMSWCTGVVAS